MTSTTRIIAVLVLFSLTATLGILAAPSPEQVKAYTRTEAYKAAEKAHWARIARQEAIGRARQAKEATR